MTIEMPPNSLLERMWLYDEVLIIRNHHIEHLKRALDDSGGMNQTLERRLHLAHKNKKSILEAKPFIIGPATLDSLIGEVPKDYECIKNHKLPFSFLFFEFYEPAEMLLGMHDQPVLARGIELFHFKNLYPESASQDEAIANRYRMRLFYQEPPSDMTHMCTLDYNPTEPHMLYVIDKNVSLVINQRTKTCGVSEQIPGSYQLSNCGTYEIHPRELSFDELNNPEGCINISNLCVNLINYINAHNVEIVKRKRNVTEIKSRKGKKKKIEKKQPFYIVTVRDTVRYEGEGPHKEGEKLKWRVYVRGHDRKFRDQVTREIYRTIWIREHVRGPKDAPWKYNRYRVLYDKLQREKNMESMMGIN